MPLSPANVLPANPKRKKTGPSTIAAKMANLRSTQKSKSFACQTPWNDENQARKGTVYQKQLPCRKRSLAKGVWQKVAKKWQERQKKWRKRDRKWRNSDRTPFPDDLLQHLEAGFFVPWRESKKTQILREHDRRNNFMSECVCRGKWTRNVHPKFDKTLVPQAFVVNQKGSFWQCPASPRSLPQITKMGSPRIDLFPVLFWVAVFLRWHVCRVNFARKIFFEPRIFLRKMLRNFPRNFWAFVLWVRKKPWKIASKFPTKFSKFPCEKLKKIHRRASAGAQGERFLCRLIIPQRDCEFPRIRLPIPISGLWGAHFQVLGRW